MPRVIENRVEIDASVEDVFAFLTSPENVSTFAPGIEECILSGGEARHEGTGMDLTTRSGKHIAAQIVWYRENRGWAVMDARETQNGWELEGLPGGRTLAINSIRGNWPDAVADRVDAEAREKVRGLARLIAPAAARVR